ncbi:hypothetical protein T12_12462 [Trichinella patagoniensis]|uniref:Uncharacterized protein n=1 Tax=Trichinella patagoniensis TaxID=990121 RepID=A0A0V0YZT6_9BILA|nr:hypothetical protein T12_12462 [Trichinella patagoniensis]
MKLVPFATRVRMDVKAFPSRPIPIALDNVLRRSYQFVLNVASQTSQTTLRQSSSAGARIDLSSVRFQCDMTKISK